MIRTAMRLIGGCALFYGLMFPAQAASSQSLEAIREAARRHVEMSHDGAGAGVTVDVGQLDARLRLAACRQELETWFPAGAPKQGNTTVGVRCGGPKPWSLFVPVAVRTIVQVVVLTRPLPAGATLTAEDLTLDARDANRLTSGYHTDPDQLIGQVLARGAGAGAPLNRLSVKAAILVKRGDRVTLSSSRGGFAVRMMGTALADAAPGERVRVKNMSSNRVVEGVVGPDHTVEIVM